MASSVYKAQNRGGKGVTGMKQREEDVISEMFTCSSHDNILFVTNKGIAYKLKCYELPEGSKQSRGTNIINLLPLSEGEKIAAMMRIESFDEGKFITMVTANGKIKRTAIEKYKNVRKNGLIAIGLDEGDEIAAAKITHGENELIVATSNGMAIRIAENKLRTMARTAHGVRAIKLRGDDRVVSMARVRENTTILTITEKGQGRKTELSNYRLQNRNGYGLTNYKNVAQKGKVCGIVSVSEDEDIMMISSDGIVIRLRVSDIHPMGRYASGVRLMRLRDDVSIVAFARAEHDDEAEIAEVEKLSEEELAKIAQEDAEAQKNEVIEENEEPDDDEESAEETEE